MKVDERETFVLLKVWLSTNTFVGEAAINLPEQKNNYILILSGKLSTKKNLNSEFEILISPVLFH